MHDRGGANNELGQHLERNLGRMRAYARVLAGPQIRARESISDLIQSVCKDVLAQPDGLDYRGETALRRYLFEAIRNKVRQRRRQLGRLKRDARREQAVEDLDALASVYAESLTASRVAIGKESVELVERALDALPEDYREAVTLAKFGGFSQRELADALDRTVPAARNLLHRAMVRLVGELDRLGVEL